MRIKPGFPIWEPIACRVSQDKKNEHGNVRFVGLEQIGKAVYDVPLEAEDILKAFSYYEEIIL